MTGTHAKLAAADLAAHLTDKLKPFGVSRAAVDDWNSYNEFSLVVFLDVRPSHTKKGAFRPRDEKAFNMQKIMDGLRTVVKFHTPNFRVDNVERLYTNVGTSKRRKYLFDGYDRDYIFISANFDHLTA